MTRQSQCTPRTTTTAVLHRTSFMCYTASSAGEQLLKNSCSLARAEQTDSFLHLHHGNHTNLLNQLKIPKNRPQSAYV